MRKFVALIVITLCAVLIQGCATNGHPKNSPRTMENLTSWQFCQEQSRGTAPEDTEWEQVNVPHVFRLSGLWEKSVGWYSQTFKVSDTESDKRFWLFLEGAGSVADIYVNNKHIGQHRGAFTAASFDLTPAIIFGADNKLSIRVSNDDEEAANCLSQSNLYYTNGGLYRPAWLIKTGSVHIYPDMGSTGVYLTPKNITDNSADLDVVTYVKNHLSTPVDVTVRHTITGPDNSKCGLLEVKANIPAGNVSSITATSNIVNPQRWNIGDGKLYCVKTEVVVDGKVVDTITERTGIRTVAMQKDCFMINDKELLARGVCKHQQGEHQWNAMTDTDLQAEWDSMLSMGCNTVRLAHYPHRRFEYSIADENGVAIWAENGLAGQKWDQIKRDATPNADGERITREMVRQNWNHPSIIFWSSGNETIQEVASHYADVIRNEDKTRLITYASAGEQPSNVDFVAGNTYQGWYYEEYVNFRQLPRNAFVSETGSGSWITHHIPYGTMNWTVDKFEPEEYNELVSEFRFQTIFRNNPSGHKMFLWWNFREFYNLKFKGNRNTKGILTMSGMPKDFYYHFQSFMRSDLPVLHLCGRHFFYRQFAPDNGIKLYSNASEVELLINGVSQDKKKNGEYQHNLPDNNNSDSPVIKIDNVFFWKSALVPGKNIIVARDNRGQSDTMVIYQKPVDGIMPVANDSLVVNLTSSNTASPAYYIDRAVEEQGAFYTEVDGTSDNTFDQLPEQVKGSGWIATKRLSDEKNRTDLTFSVTKSATVFIMFATGTFPSHTLLKPDEEISKASSSFKTELEKAGFAGNDIHYTWRQHSLWMADAGLMQKAVKPGETITIPGHKLDYVIMVKPE